MTEPDSPRDDNESIPPAAPKAPQCPPSFSPRQVLPPPFQVSLTEVVDTYVPAATEEIRLLTVRDLRSPRRRVVLPLVLFVVTCFSTFWTGATEWEPAMHMGSMMSARTAIIRHWDSGLIYMTCVLAILLTHEMGHFLATVRYRIPASFPFFLPVPITPIGTMGAVIGMDGLRANRRELFDIGLAGPLAGLFVAVPIMWIGIRDLDLTTSPTGPLAFDSPLLVKLMLDYVQPLGYVPGKAIMIGQLNPFFMAGWVGLLITGLNMLPISQLDGGHVVYTLFGKRAHWIARGFLFLAIAFIVANFDRAYIWTTMVILVTLIGTDHPPTSNDQIPLGPVRTVLGYASLLIPIFCFPRFGLWEVGF